MCMTTTSSGFPIRHHEFDDNGIEVVVECKSYNQQRRLSAAYRAELAAKLGWPVDCVAKIHEMETALGLGHRKEAVNYDTTGWH